MAKWYRMNMFLGLIYEIPERVALRKIKGKNWIQHYDTDRGEWSLVWTNTKDIQRDCIFKSED